MDEYGKNRVWLCRTALAVKYLSNADLVKHWGLIKGNILCLLDSGRYCAGIVPVWNTEIQL